jgi:large subunit ribosomal protein L30e
MCSWLGVILYVQQKEGDPKTMKKLLEMTNSKLQLAMKNGKYVLGYKQTLKMIKQGKEKLVIFVKSCPVLKKSEAQYYVTLVRNGVHHCSGSNIE